MRRKFLRKASVTECTGLGYGTIRRLILSDQFPKPVLLTTGGSVAWYEDEVEAWIESRQPVTPETQRQVAPGNLKRGRPRKKVSDIGIKPASNISDNDVASSNMKRKAPNSVSK